MATGTKVLQLTEADFDREVLQSTVPVLVDFWAAWCGPCRMVGPIVDRLAEAYDGKAKIAKVDVDAEPGLAARFGVVSIPTILYFKDGKIADALIGANPQAVLAAGLDKLIAAA